MSQKINDCREVEGDIAVLISQTSAIWALDALRRQASNGAYKLLFADDAGAVSSAICELESAAKVRG